MRVLSCLVFFLFTPLAIGSEKGADPAPAGTSVTYPDSAAGLKQLCDDMFAAIKANDIAKAKAIGRTMNLEDPEAWFQNVFGKKIGPRLAAAHAEIGDTTNIGSLFVDVMKEGRTEVIAERFTRGDDKSTTLFQSQALKVMKTPVALYSVRFVKPGAKSGFHLNSLAYVDGNFKILGEMRKVNMEPMSPELEAVASLRQKDAEVFFKTGKLPP